VRDVNWGAAWRGAGIAWMLAMVGAWNDSAMTLGAALFVTGAVLIGPLQLRQLARSRELWMRLGSLGWRLAIVVAVAFVASRAANSSEAWLAGVGSVAILTGLAAALALAAYVTYRAGLWAGAVGLRLVPAARMWLSSLPKGFS
jgi:hypothetical protein